MDIEKEKIQIDFEIDLGFGEREIDTRMLQSHFPPNLLSEEF
jgi:hypothetical protein